MIPCESWPARLALTQPTATALASSSDAPAALSSAAPMRVRRSAWTIGMGVPLATPARERGLLLVEGRMVSKRWPVSNDLKPEFLSGCNATWSHRARPDGRQAPPLPGGTNCRVEPRLSGFRALSFACRLL